MPRCKHCKQKFEAYEFNGKFCKEIDCQVQKGLFLVEKQRTKTRKETRQKKKILYPKKHKALLQDQINLLARKIDTRFYTTCIDCDRSILNGSHGAHRNNVGGNENIRFNLHNIHASTSYCNQFNAEHKPDYDKGLKSRYSEDYYNYVRYELNKLYPNIKLSTKDIDEKLTIVRKLNRDFDKTVLTDSISARNLFNKIIGIYI